MAEENNEIRDLEKDAQETQSKEDSNLEGYIEVESREVTDPRIIEDLGEKGIVIQASTGEKTIQKFGKKATVNEDFVRIFANHGMQLSQDGDGYVVTFEDGTKQQVSEENAKKLIKNGVSGGDYVQVEGVRQTTEYEKRDVTKKLKAAALLAIVPLLIILGSKACGDEKLTASDPAAVVSTLEDSTELNATEINEVLSVIYGNTYSNIQSLLDPATVVRTAQDAYEAIDYDVELMGSDLCGYSQIQDTVVTPGAEFVERVSEFKTTYTVSAFDSTSYREMIDAAKPLLEQQDKWIDTATSLVQKHAETTQECIDRGLRSEGYVEEKKVTLGQIDELQSRKESLKSVSSILEEVDRIEQGLRNGTIDYHISPQGDVVVFEGDIPVVYKSTQQAKTQTNEVTGTIGGK